MGILWYGNIMQYSTILEDGSRGYRKTNKNIDNTCNKDMIGNLAGKWRKKCITKDIYALPIFPWSLR